MWVTFCLVLVLLTNHSPSTYFHCIHSPIKQFNNTTYKFACSVFFLNVYKFTFMKDSLFRVRLGFATDRAIRLGQGKEGQDAMSLQDTETILPLTASSLHDMHESTTLHNTASILHQTAKRASTTQNSIQNDFF